MATMGFIQSAFDYDWKKAKVTLEKALQMNPNYAYAHVFYGNLLLNTDDNPEKGVEQTRKARDLEPLSVSINWALGRNYYYAGQYDLAEEQLKKTISINSRFNNAKTFLAWVLLAKKKYGEAIEWIRQIPKSGIAKNEEYQGTLLSYAYAVAGNRVQAEEELDKAIRENSFTAHYLIAETAIGLNDFNRALTELEKAYDEREIFMYFLKREPVFFPLKSKPRFKALLKKMGFD
jgi:tetratricopeptide (TPR) repeat protein